MSLTDKLELMSKIKEKPDLKEQGFWQNYEKVKELRDNIIHFKKPDSKLDEMWSPILTDLLDSNLQEFYDDFVALVVFFRPGFLE
jgi:hemerythrin superfamily protein